MIITVTDDSGGLGKSILASRLAAERGLAGRKVLLLDADPGRCALACCDAGPAGRPLVARPISAKGLQPQLEHLVTCYHDIVIDAESRDSLGSRSALIAARIVIVLFDPTRDDVPGQASLIQRIGKARMFNPGLRVLVVTSSSGHGHASRQERQRADAFAARIPAAALLAAEQLYDAVFQ